MRSIGRQKDKARETRESDNLPDYGNMVIMLGEGISNCIERELDIFKNGPERHQDS